MTMITLFCNVLKRQYTVKKICKRHSEMPNSADYYYTAYCLDDIYEIYRTPAGILYAKINTI